MATKKSASAKKTTTKNSAKKAAAKQAARRPAAKNSLANAAPTQPYIKSLVQSLPVIDIVDPSPRKGIVHVERTFDLSKLSVASAQAGLATTRGFLARLFGSKNVIKKTIEEFYDTFTEARDTLQGLADQKIVDVVSDKTPNSDNQDVTNRIIRYLLLGKTLTRLGEDITAPDDESDDKNLQTLLGVVRIGIENQFELEFPVDLPWLADDTSDAAKRYKEFELAAGNMADRLSSSLARSVVVAATAVISPIVKLPDEVSIGIAFCSGVFGRKAAERAMHKHLRENPVK